MKQIIKNRITIVVLLIGLLCFFLPDVKAQIKKMEGDGMKTTGYNHVFFGMPYNKYIPKTKNPTNSVAFGYGSGQYIPPYNHVIVIGSNIEATQNYEFAFATNDSMVHRVKMTPREWRVLSGLLKRSKVEKRLPN